MVTRGGKPGVSEALVDAAFELPEGSLSDIIITRRVTTSSLWSLSTPPDSRPSLR